MATTEWKPIQGTVKSRKEGAESKYKTAGELLDGVVHQFNLVAERFATIDKLQHINFAQSISPTVTFVQDADNPELRAVSEERQDITDKVEVTDYSTASRDLTMANIATADSWLRLEEIERELNNAEKNFVEFTSDDPAHQAYKNQLAELKNSFQLNPAYVHAHRQRDDEGNVLTKEDGSPKWKMGDKDLLKIEAQMSSKYKKGEEPLIRDTSISIAIPAALLSSQKGLFDSVKDKKGSVSIDEHRKAVEAYLETPGIAKRAEEFNAMSREEAIDLRNKLSEELFNQTKKGRKSDLIDVKAAVDLLNPTKLKNNLENTPLKMANNIQSFAGPVKPKREQATDQTPVQQAEPVEKSVAAKGAEQELAVAGKS